MKNGTSRNRKRKKKESTIYAHVLPLKSQVTRQSKEMNKENKSRKKKKFYMGHKGFPQHNEQSNMVKLISRKN